MAKKFSLNVATTKRIIIGLGCILIVLAVIIARSETTTEAPQPTEDRVGAEPVDVTHYKFTAQQIKENYSSKFNCWTIIDGNVYEITDFILSHSEEDTLAASCGADGTDIFKNRPEYEAIKEGELPDNIFQKGVLRKTTKQLLFD